MGLMLRLGPKQNGVVWKRSEDQSHQMSICNFLTCSLNLYRQNMHA